MYFRLLFFLFCNAVVGDASLLLPSLQHTYCSVLVGSSIDNNH